MSDQLLNLGLPKWPQMIVTGEHVTVDQAKEIIRRTDRAFQSGLYSNDEGLDSALADDWRMPDALRHTHRKAPYDWDLEQEKRLAWQTAWGVLDTEYVHNEWIGCCFFAGVHGWMHPDGAIGFSDNVGKWPTVEDVLNDWRTIATAFPFIVADVTLMSAESCEDAQPVVGIRVCDGNAELVDRAATPHPGLTERPSGLECEDGKRREFGIPLGWVEEWEALAARLFPGT